MPVAIFMEAKPTTPNPVKPVDENSLIKPTNKAIGNIKRNALLEIFRSLKKSPSGSHDTPHSGRPAAIPIDWNRVPVPEQPADWTFE